MLRSTAIIRNGATKAPIPKKACPKVSHLGLIVLIKSRHILETVISPKVPAPTIIIEIHSPKVDYQFINSNICSADNVENAANSLCSLRFLDLYCKNL